MQGPHEFTGSGEVWPENVWAGVTAENQIRADERIPVLLQIPATIHFVSCEPLLGPVDLKLSHYSLLHSVSGHNKMDWIIAGGETGPKARLMNPAWVRSIRDQCRVSNTPFFFKSWGEFLLNNDSIKSNNLIKSFVRVGKKIAGRLLDGQAWNEYPNETKKLTSPE